MAKSMYMVVEYFKNKDAIAVYRRFRDHGRLAPEGLLYISSWVDDKLERCYQLMETHDRTLLDAWMANSEGPRRLRSTSGNYIERSRRKNRATNIVHRRHDPSVLAAN